ncbi:hypothetical protein [Aquimarina litoralis]|nr:hypothetical protein [Aquimarina litoralis]
MRCNGSGYLKRHFTGKTIPASPNDPGAMRCYSCNGKGYINV